VPTDLLNDFDRFPFSGAGRTRDVYRAGSGPAVIVIAEIPGITPKVIEFARMVIDIGCTAYLPHLFGTPGDDARVSHAAKVAPRVCISREFAAFAQQRTAPVSLWLRALARQAHLDCGGPGVGAIGMCFTGGFALGMTVDTAVVAPVLSQPSLPIAFTARGRADLGISPEDLAVVKHRTVEEGICVLGLRFTGDKLAPGERFETLRRELGDAFIGIEIDSSPGNPWGIRKAAHSVVTEDLVLDDPAHPTRHALDQVLDFFRDRLLTP
jgi:dienelactone hydrolase